MKICLEKAIKVVIICYDEIPANTEIYCVPEKGRRNTATTIMMMMMMLMTKMTMVLL